MNNAFFPAFLNKNIQIKTLKVITMTVEFGIPSVEAFLNKNLQWGAVCI